MQIQLTGRHIEITDAIRDFVNTKFGRLERHFDHITQIHVVLKVEKDRHIAEAIVHAPGGELFAESKSDNLYTAIDSVVDKLDRQIIKHKEKIQGH